MYKQIYQHKFVHYMLMDDKQEENEPDEDDDFEEELDGKQPQLLYKFI